MDRSRGLDWEGLVNARDVGGYPTTGGGETRWGALVRSDSLAQLTPRGREAVIRYGVRTVVDLRLPFEVAGEPNPFAEPADHGIAYHNLSFIDPAAEPPTQATTLADDYTGMLWRYRRQVANVVTAVAGASDGAVVIHCAAGKDRTGLIAALLLSVVGVLPEVVADDYALTAEALRSREEGWLASGPGERSEREATLFRLRATPEVMLEVLADVNDRYSGVESYLVQAGVRADDLDRIRGRLVAS